MATTMPRNRTPVFELGTTYTRGAEFGAHIQFRDDGGNKTNIYGPSRGSQTEAVFHTNEPGQLLAFLLRAQRIVSIGSLFFA